MKRLPCIIILIVNLLLANSSVYGQAIIKRIDSVFNVQSHQGPLTGNLLVAEHGKVIYQRSFGYRDIGNNVSNTAESAFALASVSKQFTSTAILQLKEKGKLKLDDQFIKYFPDFPFPDITIRQLLNQTAGLPEYELFDELVAKEPKRIFTNADIIPALKVWKKGLYFKPGEDWRYSSMNYCLLALLIEKVCGQPLQSYLEQHIFHPAGINHTYLENLLIRRNNPNRTVNYEYPAYYSSQLVNVDSIPDQHQMIYNLGGFSGQGGLTTTAEDLLLFDNAFFAGKLVSKKAINEALSAVTLSNGKTAITGYEIGGMGSSGYGLGWFILNDTSRGRIVWHDGSRPGISTVHLHNVKTDQTVILLENTPEECNTLAVCAYHILNNEPFVAPQISLIRVYGQILIKQGADAAKAKLHSLRGDPLYKMPYDWMWVQLGFQLFEKPEYVTLAVETFKTASLYLPDSWYVSQGYAAALERTGKKQEAILMYKKCIAQNPKADWAIGRLKELESK